MDKSKKTVKAIQGLWLLCLAGVVLISLSGCIPQENDDPSVEGSQPEAKLSVTVKDLTPPTISAKEVYTVQQGQNFHLQDYVAVSDNLDKNIGYECKGTFDVSKSGQYVVLLIAKDAAGNQTQKNVSIIVTAPASQISESKSENHSDRTPSAPTEGSLSLDPGYSHDYLYAEGYTMSSASEACSNDLHASGRSGRCDPIMNTDGIYTGMRLQLY